MSVPPLVAELAVVLLAAAGISYLCTRIGLVPIVGVRAFDSRAAADLLAAHAVLDALDAADDRRIAALARAACSPPPDLRRPVG